MSIGWDMRRDRRVSMGSTGIDHSLFAIHHSPLAILLFLLFAALVLLGSPSLAASDANAFIWEQANAQAAAANVSEDYLKAAATYNRLVADDIRNGALFMNLGNTLVMAGDGANAAAAFARAERHLGATPETRQGFAAALSLQTGRARVDLPWSRTAFFWHYALPCSVRAYTALGGWTLFWLGVFCHILRRGRHPSRSSALRSLAETCALTGGLIAVVFAASTLVTLAHERQDAATWGARVFSVDSADDTEDTP